MTSYVNADLRRLVMARSSSVCEYCLIHESDTYVGCQIDHVISEKRGGLTIAENLAFACTLCNRAKGSIAPSTNQLTRFFNPRTDHWGDHFALKGALIEPTSPIGEVTVRLLALNSSERLMEREALNRLQRYPPNVIAHLIQRNDADG